MKTLRRFIDEDDMDFDEAAESAVEKRKFLLNRVVKEKLRIGWWPKSGRGSRSLSIILWINHMILIRESDGSVLIVIYKTPHKMNCSNPSPENDKKDVCRSAYHKRYYAENRERILARQKRWRTENPQAMKARNRRWYEKNMERLASSRKNNRERLNDYWRGYYAKNKKQIN